MVSLGSQRGGVFLQFFRPPVPGNGTAAPCVVAEVPLVVPFWPGGGVAAICASRGLIYTGQGVLSYSLLLALRDYVVLQREV